jgi:hypothetical protein
VQVVLTPGHARVVAEVPTAGELEADHDLAEGEVPA